jgi:uncharacterized protein YqfA (UPF0365 family)
MLVRQVPAFRLRRLLKQAESAGLRVTLLDLEAHYLAGGNPDRVIQAMFAARRRGLPDNWRLLVEADLGGKDLLELVERDYRLDDA